MKITKEQLAGKLNGCEIGSEITSAEEKLAKDSGLLVIFGASDDLCEFRGVINDEVGAWNGTTIYISHELRILESVDRDDEDVLKKHHLLDEARRRYRDAPIRIEALWAKEEGYSWTFTANVPVATFEVMEGDEHYCRGIVIDTAGLVEVSA